MAVPPQLGRGVAQRMLVVEAEFEVVLPDSESFRSRVEPLAEIAAEGREGGNRRVRRRAHLLREGRRLARYRRADLPYELNASLGDAQRRLREYTDRLDQRGARIVQKRRHILEPAQHRTGACVRAAVAPLHQEMQSPEQVGQPESRVLCLRALVLEAPYRYADVVEQRGAIDLFVERLRFGFFERGGEGP